MKQSILILVFFFISFLTGYCQPAKTIGSAKQKVMQFERDVVKAIFAGDTMKLNRYFENDYEGYYDPYFENKEMLLKNNVTPWKGVFTKEMEMKARVYGAAAVVNGIREMKWGNQKPEYRRFTDVLIQHKDGWKVVASHQNNIPAWKVRDLEDSEFVAVNAIGCETEQTLKSLNSDVSTYLRFKNKTSGKVTVRWINYAGQRDTSADQIHLIAAGKDFDQQTFVTHPFIVIGSNDKCYGIYTATSSPSMAIIKD